MIHLDRSTNPRVNSWPWCGKVLLCTKRSRRSVTPTIPITVFFQSRSRFVGRKWTSPTVGEITGRYCDAGVSARQTEGEFQPTYWKTIYRDASSCNHPRTITIGPEACYGMMDLSECEYSSRGCLVKQQQYKSGSGPNPYILPMRMTPNGCEHSPLKP